MAKESPTRPTPVDAIRHNNTRVNIPKEELRDFAPPSTGRIAVKVINHDGDEVLKVFVG